MTKPLAFTPRKRPGQTILQGDYARVEPINWAIHGEKLARAITGPHNQDLWTYIPFGPFDNLETLQNVMHYVQEQKNWETMAIIEQTTNTPLGTASFMRLRPEHGSAELGAIVFSKELQRTAIATEAIYLMSAHLFDDLGYRRNEWKCDSNNKASKSAARRFGYEFEGIFKKDLIVKHKNRDTAWFAMTDDDWPSVSAGFKKWLDKGNFDASGNQILSLKDCRI